MCFFLRFKSFCFGLSSLDCQEAWNLQVMQCMMGLYVQNMHSMQSVQNMQQNTPVTQMTNPAILLQYFGAVATSQAASREAIQNYSQSYPILGSSRGSRLHGNGESWYRLRTVPEPLDGRGLRLLVAGASGHGMKIGLQLKSSEYCWYGPNFTNHSFHTSGIYGIWGTVETLDTPNSLVYFFLHENNHLCQVDASRAGWCMPFLLSLGSIECFWCGCHSVESSGCIACFSMVIQYGLMRSVSNFLIPVSVRAFGCVWSPNTVETCVMRFGC